MQRHATKCNATQPKAPHATPCNEMQRPRRFHPNDTSRKPHLFNFSSNFLASAAVAVVGYFSMIRPSRSRAWAKSLASM